MLKSSQLTWTLQGKVHTRQSETFYEQTYLERGFEEIKLRNFKILISLITINRNFCVSLIRKEKTKSFANLNVIDLTEKKSSGKLLNSVFRINVKILKE